ncbi:MAG: BrnT family toxin [Beijerinckiaceae bacterium]
MNFEWDENKRQQVIKERNVDFVYPAQIFEGQVLTRFDNREGYGEDRWISLGVVDGECFVVVHTERNGVTRLITGWKGGRDERSNYEAGIARRHQADEGEG